MRMQLFNLMHFAAIIYLSRQGHNSIAPTWNPYEFHIIVHRLSKTGNVLLRKMWTMSRPNKTDKLLSNELLWCGSEVSLIIYASNMKIEVKSKQQSAMCVFRALPVA